MYLTTHRIIPIRTSREPTYGRDETAVHGFLYTHGGGFSVDTADIEEVTTRNPNGELAAKLIPDIPPGGNAVLSFLDIVARDDLSQDNLEERLQDFQQLVEQADTLPVETPTSQDVYVKYHISQPSYADTVDWRRDFDELKDRAFELFEHWKAEMTDRIT